MNEAFSPRYRWYVLGAMSAVYMLNFVDRGLMMLLLEPIKDDLQLSDTQLGFLTGIAFALFYAVLGLPMARWADRGDRVSLAALAMGLWGMTVMACLFVGNFAQLLAARIAAAVGEAGCTPPTYSLVGDYFPGASERTRAMSIYAAGSTLSGLISMIAGGWINEHYGWRTTFFVMGVPGLLLAILLKLTVIEPRTREARADKSPQSLPALGTVLALMWKQRTARHLTAAMIVLYAVSLGLSPWYAAFLIRSHGLGTAELGLWMGLSVGIAGTLGVLLGGYISGKWFERNERGQLRFVAVSIAALLPLLAAFLLVSDKHSALLLLLPLVMAFNAFFGPVYALLQRVVCPDMRATMLAVVLLLANLIGMGLGPQLVGILSDLLRDRLGIDSLRYAMLAVSVLVLWGAWHFWKAGQTVGDDLA